MTAFPDNPTHVDIQSSSHLPQDPTRSQLIERYWYAFLKFQQAEIKKRMGSGFGVPKMDYREQAFWEWLIDKGLLDDAN